MYSLWSFPHWKPQFIIPCALVYFEYFKMLGGCTWKEFIHKPKLEQNVMATAMVSISWYIFMTTVLWRLHWCPVGLLVQSKMLIVTIKSLHDSLLEYLRATFLSIYLPIQQVRIESDPYKSLLLKFSSGGASGLLFLVVVVVVPMFCKYLPMVIQSVLSLVLLEKKLLKLI